MGKGETIAEQVHGKFARQLTLFPFQIPILHAIVVAIADKQKRLPLPGIHGDSMAGVKLALLRARSGWLEPAPQLGTTG